MGLDRTQLMSISSAAEMAVLLDSKAIGTWVTSGTLARAPLAGGAPREMLEQVQWADWAPDGSTLAVVRDFGGRNRLEYPVGKSLYETGGWIGHPRVSPKGNLIAFLDHPNQGDDSGSLAIVDLKRNKRILSGEWFTVQGLAWSPDGSEIWFTASKSGTDRTLYAITLDGKERMVLRLPGALMLLDISKDGRVLLMRASWFPDQKRILFTGNEPDKGVRLNVYDLQSGKTTAISPEGVHGTAFVISPDSQTVAGIGPDQKGYLYPANGGEPSVIKGLNPGEQPIVWSADGHAVYVYQPGELPARVYRVELQTGQRTLWKQLMPSDPAGVENIVPILLTPDAKTCVFGYHRMLADLYLVEGLK